MTSGGAFQKPGGLGKLLVDVVPRVAPLEHWQSRRLFAAGAGVFAKHKANLAGRLDLSEI